MTAAIFSSRRRPVPRAQLSLDWALARNTDPLESKLAAARVDVTAAEQRVLDALRRWGPQTSYEVADRLGLSVEKVSPRFAPLCDKGKIERTGERRESRACWRAK